VSDWVEMAAAALMRCALRFLHAEARGWQGSLVLQPLRLTQVVPVAIVSALAQLCAPNEF